MKLTSPLLLCAIALVQTFATAQTPAPAKPHTAAHATTSAHAPAAAATHGCSKLPPLSPKIPALPPGMPCAKPLYTITTVPTLILSDVSPLAATTLRDDLGIPLAATFSLSYADIKIGTGEPAAPHKWYSVNYTGYLTDGTKFDSSLDPGRDPLVFQQGPQGPQGRRQVVVGMDTGIDGMRAGGKRRLFIPYQLNYGPAGNPQAKIPPKSWLIFDVELVAQSDKAPEPKAPPAAAKPAASAPTNTAPAAPANTAPTAAAPDATPAKPQ
jgi:peptidylprolyl isomerase